jgi:predicted SprT family Zn-dependent metalloprotease
MMTINTNSMLDEECGQEFFDSVTDEELIYLWRWIKGRGISANEAWNVVLTDLLSTRHSTRAKRVCRSSTRQ